MPKMSTPPKTKNVTILPGVVRITFANASSASGSGSSRPVHPFCGQTMQHPFGSSISWTVGAVHNFNGQQQQSYRWPAFSLDVMRRAWSASAGVKRIIIRNQVKNTESAAMMQKSRSAGSFEDAPMANAAASVNDVKNTDAPPVASVLPIRSSMDAPLFSFLWRTNSAVITKASSTPSPRMRKLMKFPKGLFFTPRYDATPNPDCTDAPTITTATKPRLIMP
mmetsp:Transcript_23485/g.51725  ORF Transcript_23485/g.51725 Transcript_23485/m.51725 type:complete len:222 (-) Transcript_23485:1111-1776(-)